MMFGQRESNSYLAAVFSYGFLDEHIGDEAIARIHRGEIDQWIRDLAASGLFSVAEVRAAELGWRKNPRLLLDVLLAEADDVSVKRWEIAWARLEGRTMDAHSREVFVEYLQDTLTIDDLVAIAKRRNGVTG